MINWETIKSLYNDKPTLLQWLKKVEAALAASVLQSVDVEKVSTSEIKLNFIFEDGTNIETPTIALPYEIQGVAIVNGHLILTLESGETLDAGNLGAVSGFSIDASQHLIVTYQDGSTQDLGDIFNGNVNIAGNLTADSIIENMNGYSFTKYPLTTPLELQYAFAGIVKNGNKITLVIAGTLIRKDNVGSAVTIGKFIVPSAVGSKLIPFSGQTVSYKKLYIAENSYTGLELYSRVTKNSDTNFDISVNNSGMDNMSLNTSYYFRFEETYLLSENLAA